MLKKSVHFSGPRNDNVACGYQAPRVPQPPGTGYCRQQVENDVVIALWNRARRRGAAAANADPPMATWTLNVGQPVNVVLMIKNK